jgi:hypothetical protein
MGKRQVKIAAVAVLGLAVILLLFLYIRGSICGMPHTAVPSGGAGLTEFAPGAWCKKFPWQRENGQGTDIPLPVSDNG